MATNRTQRLAERNEFINERIRQTVYKAWYQYHLKPTERGTYISKMK